MKWIASTLLLLLVTACLSQSQEKGTYTTLERQTPSETAEVLVRLCPNMDKTKAKQHLKQHNILLHKQTSPVIWTLRWNDKRTVAQIITELKSEKTTFCVVQQNYRYQIQ